MAARSLPVSARSVRWLAWSLFGLCIACQVTTLALVIWGSAPNDQLFILITIGYAVVGLLVALREPANAIGWLLLVGAASLGLEETGIAYVVAAEGPAEPLAAWLAVQLVWLYVGIVLLPLLYPTGRLPTPRWRPALQLGVAGLVSSTSANCSSPACSTWTSRSRWRTRSALTTRWWA